MTYRDLQSKVDATLEQDSTVDSCVDIILVGSSLSDIDQEVNWLNNLDFSAYSGVDC